MGVPFYQGSHEAALELCRKVKSGNPGIIIAGGGPLMTARYDALLGTGAVDLGVVGEGELPIYEIASASRNGRVNRDNVTSSDAIAFPGESGPIFNENRRHVENLDELPFIDYSLIDMAPYFKMQDELEVPRSVFMTTSRGCAYKCTFCASPNLWPGRVRRYSPARVLAEMEFHARNFGKINIGFLDDSFFADKKWLAEFFAGAAKTETTYSCIGRADHIGPEEAELLGATGCRFVSMGVESGSARMQKLIRKKLDLSKVRGAVSRLSSKGIYCRCFFMAGFPDETVEEMAETINLAVDLKKAGMTDCTFFIANLYAGTELSSNYDSGLWRSKIYRGGERETGGGFSDEKMLRYSSVPDADLNPFLDRSQLVALVKTAYSRINRLEYITASEILKLTETARGGGAR